MGRLEGLSCVACLGEKQQGKLLCAKDEARALWQLGELPDIAARARLAIIPGKSAGGEKVSGTRMPESPINTTALEVCEEIVQFLADWLLYFADELNIQIPGSLMDGKVTRRGIAAGTDPVEVSNRTGDWCVWLRMNLDDAVTVPGGCDFLRGLSLLTRSAGRMFPATVPRALPQRSRYCPVCLERKVRVSWEGAEPLVACTGCGHRISVDWKEIIGVCVDEESR